MENIRLPEELLPKNLKKPAAFIAKKDPSLPDYGIHTGDLVIVEQESVFTDGELSVFACQMQNQPKFRLFDKQPANNLKYLGKVIVVLKYYQDSPFHNLDYGIVP